MASPYALLIAFHNLRIGRTYLIRLKRNPEIELLMTDEFIYNLSFASKV